MTAKHSLLLTSCTWDGGHYQSFRMIPVSQACPYVEAFYDPSVKVLVVLSKDQKESLQLVPKLDEYGNAVKKNNRPVVDRQRVHSYKEFYIEQPEEIRSFVQLTAVNADAYDFERFLEAHGGGSHQDTETRREAITI